MTTENHLRVHTNLTDLYQVIQWFEQLHQPTIPRQVWIQCKTALAEGFTNAVKHAHKGLPVSTPIDIHITMTPQQLEIRIWDSGATFDFTQKLASQSPTPDCNAVSGRGLKLIFDLVDHFSYTRTEDDRNCLLMVKHY